MSSFIHDKFIYSCAFDGKIKLDRIDEQAVEFKKSLGSDFVVDIVSREATENSGPRIVLKKQEEIIIFIEEDNFMVFTSSIDDGAIDEARMKSLKDACLRLLGLHGLAERYVSLLVMTSGYYLPSDEVNEEQSFSAVCSLIKKLVRVGGEDPVMDLTLDLKMKTSYGFRGVEYSVVQNKSSNLYALNMEVSSFIRPDNPMPVKEVIPLISEVNVIGDLKNELSNLDKLV